jgi:hypothetical protein
MMTIKPATEPRCRQCEHSHGAHLKKTLRCAQRGCSCVEYLPTPVVPISSEVPCTSCGHRQSTHFAAFGCASATNDAGTTVCPCVRDWKSWGPA